MERATAAFKLERSEATSGRLLVMWVGKAVCFFCCRQSHLLDTLGGSHCDERAGRSLECVERGVGQSFGIEIPGWHASGAKNCVVGSSLRSSFDLTLLPLMLDIAPCAAVWFPLPPLSSWKIAL